MSLADWVPLYSALVTRRRERRRALGTPDREATIDQRSPMRTRERLRHQALLDRVRSGVEPGASYTQRGDEYVVKNGAGDICATFRDDDPAELRADPDLLDRWP